MVPSLTTPLQSKIPQSFPLPPNLTAHPRITGALVVMDAGITVVTVPAGVKLPWISALGINIQRSSFDRNFLFFVLFRCLSKNHKHFDCSFLRDICEICREKGRGDLAYGHAK